jgi:hypothetical protein
MQRSYQQPGGATAQHRRVFYAAKGALFTLHPVLLNQKIKK